MDSELTKRIGENIGRGFAIGEGDEGKGLPLCYSSDETEGKIYRGAGALHASEEQTGG